MTETLALNEDCETAIYICNILEEILALNRIPIIDIKKNKSLSQVANTLTLRNGKLLRGNLASICQLCEIKHVTSRRAAGKYQLCNCLTKNGASLLHLLNVLKTGVLE